MYFHGTLSIDPAQATKIERAKPTKAFGKLFYALTAGLSSKKEELETFSAVSILQQINHVMRSLGINNIVRLAQDKHNFYLDTEGRTDDLQEALEEYLIKVDEIESELFEHLFLVLEHADEHLSYLIEIDVSRRHAPGIHPISIKVNGLAERLRMRKDEKPTDVKRRMQQIMSTQESHDEFVNSSRIQFDEFVHKLELAIRTYIKVDEVNKKSSAEIIRPKQPVNNKDQIKNFSGGQPVYGGYYGTDNSFFYAYMWSSMLHSNNIHVADVSVVDEAGSTIMDIGADGIDAGESNALNPAEDFEAPTEGDVEFHNEHDFQDAIPEPDSGSSWLDSFGSDFGGDSDSASCSSCSSCGGCGGD